MSGTSLVLVAMLAFTATPWAAAQQATPVAVTPSAGQSSPLATEDLEELEEVIVRGGRLYDLIIKAEDEFFKLYNELNKDPDYRTNCAFLTLDPDSRIEQRVCMPSFFADAKAEQVRFNMLCESQTTRDEEDRIVSRGSCYEPPPAELIFMDRRDAYVRNVMKVIDSNPRLREMAEELDVMHRERDMLARRYDDIKMREQNTNSMDPRRNRQRVR